MVAFECGYEVVGWVECDAFDVVEIDQVFSVGAEEEVFWEAVFEGV